MATLQITLELPEDIVYEARELAILNDKIIAELLRQEIAQRVMIFVNDEIHAHRTEKRQAQIEDKAT